MKAEEEAVWYYSDKQGDSPYFFKKGYYITRLGTGIFGQVIDHTALYATIKWIGLDACVEEIEQYDNTILICKKPFYA